jgi:hypothetical protein
MVNGDIKYVFNTEIIDYRSQGVVEVSEVNVCFTQGEEL